MLLALVVLLLVPVAAHAESPALKAELARLAATKGPFTFAVMGDNRSGDRVFAKVVAQLVARAPLFVMGVGDAIAHTGDREAWAHFRELASPITVPIFLAPGNHDIDGAKSVQVWRDVNDLPGNELFYSFTVGRNLFVVLNSHDPSAEQRIPAEQLSWLAGTLDPTKYDHQFVFLHHPPFLWKGATHEGEALDRYPAERDRLHALLAEKKATIVFAGHEHTYRRMRKDGVVYVVTGGAGSPLYGKGSFNHGIVLRVDGPRVEAKVIDREGVLRDEFVLAP